MNQHLKTWYSKAVRSGRFILANRILYWLQCRSTILTIGDGFDEAWESGFAGMTMAQFRWVNGRNGYTVYLPTKPQGII